MYTTQSYCYQTSKTQVPTKLYPGSAVQQTGSSWIFLNNSCFKNISYVTPRLKSEQQFVGHTKYWPMWSFNNNTHCSRKQRDDCLNHLHHSYRRCSASRWGLSGSSYFDTRIPCDIYTDSHVTEHRVVLDGTIPTYLPLRRKRRWAEIPWELLQIFCFSE